MREIPSSPVYCAEIDEWVVDVNHVYAPGEQVKTLHSTWSFPTEDEALACVAELRGQVQ